MSLLFALLLAFPVEKDATQYLFEVTIYQGNPDGQKERLSNPQIVTRNGQQALICVGQMVPIVSDIKKQIGKTITTVTEEQVGIIVKLTPKSQEDGSIFLTGNTSIKEAISDSSIMEHVLTFNQLLQPGRMEIVPFYNAKEHAETSVGILGKTRKKPFSGKEMWMEITVNDLKSDRAKPIIPKSQPLPTPNSP